MFTPSIFHRHDSGTPFPSLTSEPHTLLMEVQRQGKPQIRHGKVTNTSVVTFFLETTFTFLILSSKR
jgi:hypothetical protein